MHFGVKLAWFFLSAIGLLCCWIVLFAFVRVTGMRWGPILYGTGNTLVQGILCLGMIYKMDPYQMPRSFCISQTLIINLGSFMMCGVTLASSIATYAAAGKPKLWGDFKVSDLRWKNKYVIPTFAFPLCATIVHTTFVLKFDSVHPTNGLHCDSSHPEWVRFLGYAGIPFIVLWPSLYLSVKSVMIIRKTNQHLMRARPESATDFTSSRRTARKRDTLAQWVGFSPPERPIHEAFAVSTPSVASPATRKFNLPFASPGFGGSTTVTSPSTFEEQDLGDFDDASSKISVSFPTFVNPDEAPPTAQAELAREVSLELDIGQEDDDDGEISGAQDSEAHYHEDWNDNKVELKSMSESIKDEYAMDDMDAYSPRQAGLPTSGKSRRPMPILAPAVWRIILFQIAFITVQVLACVSTIIDIATRRSSPAPLGTQHVALLLAGWGPVIVFGHLPSVRRNLRWWRPVV